MATTAQADARRRNLGSALRTLHDHGPVRQAELAARVGVNRSTMLPLVQELLRLGLAEEGVAVSTGQRGRPSPVISASANAVAVVAEISPDRARVQLVELGGMIHAGTELTMRPASGGLKRTLARVDDTVADMVAGESNLQIVGACLALHGAVDFDGRLTFAPNLGWTGEVGLAGRQLPSVHVGNNADLGALAELRRGAGRGRRHFVYIAAERGIGGGLVINGQVVRGASGLAGEIGHMKVTASNAVCGCGQRGCWEAEIGQQALADRASVASVDNLFEQARGGQRAAIRVIQEAGTALGRGLATLAAVLQPEAVVLGGHLPSILELGALQVHAAMAQACPPQLDAAVEVVSSVLAQDAAIVGAAELVFDNLFDDPAHTARDKHAS